MERLRPGDDTPGRCLIDEVVVDFGQRKLWRGGQSLPVTRLTFDLLRTLIEEAPNVVGHEQIIARVWGAGRIVSPETLAQCVLRLRHSLTDDANDPRYIESIRGSGYRLIPAVRPLTGTAEVPGGPDGVQSAPSTRWRWRWRPVASLAVLCLLVALIAMGLGQMLGDPVVVASGLAGSPLAREVQPRSIAVLPIATEGMEPTDAALADGIHAEILSELARIGELSVIARATMMRYAGTELSVSEIADALNVETVMQLDLHLLDRRLDLTAELIDGRSGAQRRFDRYENSLDEVSAVEREVAASVADALGAQLSDPERARLQARPTVSAEAYEFFLTANDAFELDFADRAMIAQSSLDRAIALDPEFARAYGFKALIYAYGIDDFTDSSENLLSVHGERARLAERYAAKAIEIDSDTLIAHRARAIVGMHSWRWNEAKQAFETALEVSPNDIATLSEFAFFRVCALREDGGLEHVRRALELDPDNPRVHEMYGRSLNCAGDNESALAAMRRASELDPTSYRLRAMGTYFAARVRPADEVVQELRVLEPMLRDVQLQSYPPLALTFRSIGYADDARRIIARFEALGGHEMSNLGNSVFAYLAVGDEEAAYRNLERAVSHLGPGSGYLTLIAIRHNRRGIPALDEPRFIRLRERIGSLD